MHAREVVRKNFTDDLWNCDCVVGNTILCNVCFGSFHVGLRSPNQNELHCTDRFFFPRWAKTTWATRDDPMTASLPWLTSCSCVVVVCVLELLSATSSWAKATKTERQERHDESLHARNRICHVCAAQRGWNAVEPCLSTTSKTSTWPQVCVCGMEQADLWQYLNMPKSNMPKHAERRNMPDGPPLCMQMTHFTWLTRCSCGWVVCMLEMLSAKTSLTPCGIVQQVMILRRNMPEGPPLCMQMNNFTDWLVVVVVESYAC